MTYVPVTYPNPPVYGERTTEQDTQMAYANPVFIEHLKLVHHNTSQLLDEVMLNEEARDCTHMNHFSYLSAMARWIQESRRAQDRPFHPNYCPDYCPKAFYFRVERNPTSFEGDASSR